MPDNHLYYGDNLDILRHQRPDYVPENSVDLIYLDPPFNSGIDYNVLFAERDGSRSTAQIQAFEDTWHWDTKAAETFHEVISRGGPLAQALVAFRHLVGESDMLAYLTMMAPRLVELHRVLKSTGSIYLHCDPTASHYLKLLMDAIFGPLNFRSEIVWRRTGAHGKARRWAPIHDIILFYTKTNAFKWTSPKRPYMRGHVDEHLVHDERGWRTKYYGNVLTGSGTRNGESGQPWLGIDPTAKGRHWAVPKALVDAFFDETGEDLGSLSQRQKLERLYELGYIKLEPGDAWPIYEHYLDPLTGSNTLDTWAFQPYTGGTVFGTTEGIDEDVRWLSPRDKERLGYQTQKPLGLLERIIRASSDPGDVVLDPFCGCGTTIDAAQRLGRKWIGIDVTILAIHLIRARLFDAFGSGISSAYDVTGEPTTVSEARALALEDRFQLQGWVCYRLGAGPRTVKKGGDGGIDGRIYFVDDASRDVKQVIVSVKSGSIGPAEVRELVGTVDNNKAQIGVMVTLEDTTPKMRTTAADAGTYTSPYDGRTRPRIQILTIRDLLDGKGVDMPPAGQTSMTLKRATRAKTPPAAAQLSLTEVSAEDGTGDFGEEDEEEAL